MQLLKALARRIEKVRVVSKLNNQFSVILNDDFRPSPTFPMKCQRKRFMQKKVQVLVYLENITLLNSPFGLEFDLLTVAHPELSGRAATKIV